VERVHLDLRRGHGRDRVQRRVRHRSGRAQGFRGGGERRATGLYRFISGLMEYVYPDEPARRGEQDEDHEGRPWLAPPVEPPAGTPRSGWVHAAEVPPTCHESAGGRSHHRGATAAVDFTPQIVESLDMPRPGRG